MDESFALSEGVSPEHTVVSVTGEVDVATAPALQERLEAVLDRGTPSLVVDLLGVTFLDSTGLGALVRANTHAEDAGTPLRLVVAEPRIRKVFEIAGLTDVLSLHSTLAEATGR